MSNVQDQKLEEQLAAAKEQIKKLEDQNKELTVPKGLTWGELLNAAAISARMDQLRSRAEAAEAKLAHLESILAERLRRIECLNDKLKWAYPVLLSANTDEARKALTEMDRITGEYNKALGPMLQQTIDSMDASAQIDAPGETK